MACAVTLRRVRPYARDVTVGELLLIARNPDPASRLPFLLRLPIGGGMVFRTSGTWPRTKALYCHPVPADDWPEHADLVEQVAVRSCVRRGAAIDLVLDRGRENRSQIVFTTARGRDVCFWQSPRTRKQARPRVSTPAARAAGLADLEIIVDAHERYAYRFSTQQVTTARQALPCGDYGVAVDGRLVASVERKSLEDLLSSLTSGRLRFAMTELAALPRAAVVVEERYSKVFAQQWVRPAVAADGLAELQVHWPNVPIVFAETRSLAEEWVYRFLAQARRWAVTEDAAATHLGGLFGQDPDGDPGRTGLAGAPAAPAPSTAQVRAWARSAGLEVSDRGRLRPEIWRSWREAHGSPL